MSFSNLEYLYHHLPEYMRRDDEETLFLKRFLTPYGETLDEWDTLFDNFFEQIAPETASEEFIDWWMWALFDWSWYPRWFALADKRVLYAHMGRHLARRGTRRGIVLWLYDFGIVARVHASPVVYGEFIWGETSYSVTEPLRLVIEILFIKDRVNYDLSAWGEFIWGESLWQEPQETLSESEIDGLLRFVQPAAQEFYVVWAVAPEAATGGDSSDLLLLL